MSRIPRKIDKSSQGYWGNRFILSAIIQGAVITILTLIYAGLAGSGILDVVLNGTTLGTSSTINIHSNVDIMVQFIIPISGFAGLLSIGVISGGLPFILTFFNKS